MLRHVHWTYQSLLSAPGPLLCRAQLFVDEGLPVLLGGIGHVSTHFTPVKQPPPPPSRQGVPAVQGGADHSQQPQKYVRGCNGGGASSASGPGRKPRQYGVTANRYNGRTLATDRNYDSHVPMSATHTSASPEFDTIRIACNVTLRSVTSYLLFKHIVVELSYNGPYVVEASTGEPSMSTDPMDYVVDITSAQQLNVTFTYGLKWRHKPNITYAHRLDHYHSLRGSVSSFQVGIMALCVTFQVVYMATVMCWSRPHLTGMTNM